MSSTTSDVLEVIEFFKTGYLFNIKGTEVGMRQMLRLLYVNTGQDKNEKGEAVIKAYHNVLFGTDATGRFIQSFLLQTVTSLIRLSLYENYFSFKIITSHQQSTSLESR